MYAKASRAHRQGRAAQAGAKLTEAGLYAFRESPGKTRSLYPGRQSVAAPGYTDSMKTAVSIPDDLFAAAQKLAQRTRRSRSRVFSDALKEYVARHAPDDVTDAMDRVCAEIGGEPDRFVAAASHRALKRIEW